MSVTAATLVGVACSSGGGVRVAQITPQPLGAEDAAPVHAFPLDAVAALLHAADTHFEAGQQELALGHLSRAKVEFNRALEVLLESPQGVRADRRLHEHFDRLVERIAALELAAIAKGDGFTERTHEPASLDELLAFSTFAAEAPTRKTTEDVQADLEQTTHDIPIPLNDRVLRYVEIFQGRLREFLTSGLERGAQYLPMIQSVFRAEGLPLDLAYIPLIESAFKPTALSRARAKGVWQFMSATAREQGLKQDWYVDERSDPGKATVAAARYLKMLYGMFGDWHLAMASYNGGPGRVQRAMKASGRKDFWSLSATSRYLPQETREYVPMILAAVIIARNPANYGFYVEPPPRQATKVVEVPPAVDLRRVAEWAGVPATDIQRLNPELRRWTTPIREHYSLQVPAEAADAVRARLAFANPGELNALQWYTVKRGETLTTIARRLRVNRTDLVEANYLRSAATLRAGQKLLVPTMPSAALLARAGRGHQAVADTIAGADGGDAEEPGYYEVRAGDTLSAIARRHGTTVENLKAWNALRSDSLRIGTRLVVRGDRTANTQQQ